MLRHNLLTASAALALSGCGGSAPANNSQDDVATPASTAPVPEANPPVPSEFSTPPASSPTQTPMASPPSASPSSPPLVAGTLSPPAQKGPAGAQAVLRTWAEALESRQFDVAWAQFGNPPASRAAFSRWWGRYRSIKVTLGPGEGDAAMGSLYYTAPATLTGTTVEGKPFRLQGDVVVRRVNDVDGATPAQLRWHIGTADLKDAAAP